MAIKSWYTSKTLWFNILSGILVIVQLATEQAWISIETQALIIVVVNFILRTWFTDTKLTK